MKRAATAAEIDYAETWLRDRRLTVATEGPNAIHPKPIWFFAEGELPHVIRIVIDQLYAKGDEAYFQSREVAVNALAVTLAECIQASSNPPRSIP